MLVGREGSKKDGRQRQGPSGIDCATVQLMRRLGLLYGLGRKIGLLVLLSFVAGSK